MVSFLAFFFLKIIRTGSCKTQSCTLFSDVFAQFQVEVLIDCNIFPIQDYIGSLLVFLSAISSLATCLTGQTSPAYVGLSITYALQVCLSITYALQVGLSNTYALQVWHSLIDKKCVAVNMKNFMWGVIHQEKVLGKYLTQN